MNKSIIAGGCLILIYLVWLSVSPWASKLVPPDAVYPDGSRYYGDRQQGIANGYGEWRKANGTRYIGHFKAGMFDGPGEYWGADGSHYKGLFEEGLRSGLGTLSLANGDHYSGMFANDLFHDFGRYQTPSGDRYEGEFKAGQMSGNGIYTTAFGATFSGRFEADAPVYGVHQDESGNQYTGTFKDWYYHGQGEYLTADNTLYKGQFEVGSLSGAGEQINSDGARYLGEFQDWSFHGRGQYTEEDGDIYVGQFDYGYYHGEGTLTLAKPVNGVKEISGQWDYGRHPDDPRRQDRAESAKMVEAALYSQDTLLDQQFQNIGAENPEQIDLFFLGIGSYSSQDVFRKEIDTITELFRQPDYANDRIITLINNPNSATEQPLATQTSVKRSLATIANKMNVEQDILFMYFTSHGSKDHKLSIQMKGLRLPDMGIEALESMLSSSGIKWKVIVISACYSGGFIPALADEHTLVITSAREDRTSFGCSDDSDMTYFGRAYFNHALPESTSFIDAFDQAKTLIAEWEQKDFPNSDQSEPQIHIGAAIEQHLKQWR